MNKDDKTSGKQQNGNDFIADVMPSLPTIDEIKLDPVYGSTYCQYSVIENKLEILYKNQEKLLQAIKLLCNGA